MNIDMLFAFFALTSLQAWVQKFSEHLATVDMLSFFIAGFTALMMWLAYRRVRSEKWIQYFAITFALLAAQYLYAVLVGFVTADHSNSPSSSIFRDIVSPLIAQLLSIGTNLLGIAAARDIQNRKPLFPIPLGKARPRRKEEPLIPWGYKALALISLITAGAGVIMKIRGPLTPPEYIAEWVGRSGESIFSAITLFVVGYTIVANLRVRRSPLRPVALLLAGAYGLIQIGFGLSPWLAETYISAPSFRQKLVLFDAFLIFFALIFKIFLSIATYLLVIRFFETLNELRQLQDSGFEKRQDYLSSEGVADVIGERLVKSTSKRRNTDVSIPPHLEGFVNLVIRLPGENNKRVACIWWPNAAKEKKARILDWKPRMHQFSPLGDPEDPHNRGKYLEWEKALNFVDVVLAERDYPELILPEDQSNLPRDVQYDGRMRAIANVVIRADGAAVGCLQVARSTFIFSQMAIRQIRGIANLLSAPVQAYRELAGLDNMSIRFAERQADERTYSSDRATAEIATILHDLFGSTLTRFCIDFGFSGPELIYQIKAGEENVRVNFDKALVDNENHSEGSDDNKPLNLDLKAEGTPSEPLLDKRRQDEKQLSGEKKWEDYPVEFNDIDGTEYRILKKGLTARVTETLSYEPLHEPDRFFMGHLVLAVNSKKDDYSQPALGTTYLHRKGASTLAADAYLDFQRDYHNDILKQLGQELSAKRINVDEWFEPIQRLLTKDAALSWVVAKQKSENSLLGDERGRRVVERLEDLKFERRMLPGGQSEINAHYALATAVENTYHVLELNLPSSDTFIWLGVTRKGFSSELDFNSPWKAFLVNFVQIADAALSRITFPEKFEVQLEAAQLQGIIASLATTGTVIHQFRNMIAGQLLSIRKLLETTHPQKDVEQSLILMRESANRMMELFESMSRLTTGDERRPCQLIEAARHAFRLFELSLVMRGIKSEIDISEDLYADVPFNIAALALATLVGNSKDAIQGKAGTIRIEANRSGDDIICRVIDDGIGIHSEVQTQIFEPKSRTKRYGTGLGLFLTAHSLSDNASSISLTKSDETGTIFTIRFPLGKGVN